MTELPLACSLDSDGAARQAERYAAIGASLSALERDGRRVIAVFGPDLDEQLLAEATAVERECCPFFSIEFDPSRRRLEIAVPDVAHEPALDAVQGALTRMGAWDGSTSST
jgi:hypothetical protein